jgi:oligoribonuclease (3'-5' exoribonuclease)
VVVVAFQIAFVPKYMPMMFFHFLKIIFDISTSKRSKKYKPHSILAKKKQKKNLKFGEKQVQLQNQTAYLVSGVIVITSVHFSQRGA